MSGFRQLAAALSSTGSAQQYAHDMDRMRSVLSAAPQQFPWGTASLLVLALLAWLAVLSLGWMYLNRRMRRPQTNMRDSVQAAECVTLMLPGD